MKINWVKQGANRTYYIIEVWKNKWPWLTPPTTKIQKPLKYLTLLYRHLDLLDKGVFAGRRLRVLAI
jgi:hypothetical protein